MDELLQKVKDNLILSHSEDDELLRGYIRAAVSYAESYQHIPSGHYADNPMPPTTEQAVIMLSSHFYESRDGSTGGFFADNVQAGQQVWNTVNLLLRLDREWPGEPMSYEKMRAPVQLLSTEAVKDAEGFATQQDKVLAEVRAYHEARHGSERWANRAAFSEATDLFRFRAIPGVEVSTKLFLLCEGCRYDITSVEDVKGRGMYVEILAKKVVAANG